MDTKRTTPANQNRMLTLVPAVMFIVVAFATVAILLGSAIMQNMRPAARPASAAPAITTHIALDIMPVKPGGPSENWPAFMASTPLTIPANQTITVTIRNFDLGDAALADNSPLAKVQGTIGGTASFNGTSYNALDVAKVAHTFTIPQLGLNVPIPGDAPDGASFLTVTFSFRVSHAGTYEFECLAPCGTGDGFGGPMASMAFMKGTLTVRS